MSFATLSKVLNSINCQLKPPPKLTVSQWADAYRYLSAESSSAPGKWHTHMAPYQRGMMDVINEPGVKTAVLMCSAQVGKTEIINNAVGYFIDQAPSTLLLLQPTLEMATTWSKDRLAPMLRDTPRLSGKVRDARSRDSGNTLLHKQFPGGHITMAGANSPASLASRPIRIVCCDEVDRYPPSAGSEGDPVALARKRTTTYHNALCILTSTPTIKGNSRIEKAFLESDRRYYWVPCPLCGYQQRLIFSQLKWGDAFDNYVLPEQVHYECIACKQLFSDAHNTSMLQAGQWVASEPFRGTAGFHISELYSPWVRWFEVVNAYLEVKDDAEQYKTWVNTVLGEAYQEEIAEACNPELLLKRREAFGFKVPRPASVLTAGVDVQIDRLVVQVVAWSSNNYESWVMDYRVFPGNPAETEVWGQLDEYLLQPWQHEKGDKLHIAGTFVDSGYQTQVVYRFTRVRAARHVFAVKGMAVYGEPIVTHPKRKKGKIPVLLVHVGVDTAKNLLFSRLKIAEPGPSYIHFPKRLTKSYFMELTAEQCVEKNGKIRWVKKEQGQPNEALDTYVYALAAIEYLKPNFRYTQRKQDKQAACEKQEQPVFQRRKTKVKKSKSFVRDF